MLLLISFKNMTLGLLLIAAAALSLWSIWLTRQSSPTHPISSNRPDAFMEDVTALIINKEGKPVLKVVAPKMTHYPADDSTDINTPTITVFRKESPNPWFINANHAKTIQGIQQINFWENVVIHHPADKRNPLTTMHTNSLTVFPEKQIAETQEPVVIKQPASTIHAIGMLANLNDATVRLLSQAREDYVPNS